VCQHQTVAGAMFRTMKKSANRRIECRIAKGLEGSGHASEAN
jgi:hypothetical protein